MLYSNNPELNDVYSGNYDCYGNIYDKKSDGKIRITTTVKYCMLVREDNITSGQILKNCIVEIGKTVSKIEYWRETSSNRNCIEKKSNCRNTESKRHNIKKRPHWMKTKSKRDYIAKRSQFRETELHGDGIVVRLYCRKIVSQENCIAGRSYCKKTLSKKNWIVRRPNHN